MNSVGTMDETKYIKLIIKTHKSKRYQQNLKKPTLKQQLAQYKKIHRTFFVNVTFRDVTNY